MSPQSTRRKRGEANPNSPTEKRKAILKAITDGYTEEGNLLHDLFRKGVDLEGRKRAIFTEITKNRRSLRDLAGQGLANQQDVDALYPPKASGSSADNGDEPAE